ncbi:MAG: hypothetical protein NTV23_06785 [Propionibacteriales bacterium]|nr:hypothetical protein [Propionibacteriales bacterium]
MTRRRGQGGTAIVEFIWLALLLLVPLLYVVLAAAEAQRTAYAASAAARSASRAFVEAPDQRSGWERARRSAELAFADQGLDTARLQVRITCRPRPVDCLSPGSVVTAEVGAAAVLPLMPSILGDPSPGIAITAEHRSPYGTFRAARP